MPDRIKTFSDWYPYQPLSIKCMSRNCDIRVAQGQVNFAISPLSQWEENERRLFLKKTIRNTLKHRMQVDQTPWVGILRPVTTRHVAKVISGPERLPAIFLAITFDRYQLEQRKYHRCVQDDHTDRLICKMTYSDQVMTLTWGLIFKVIFFKIKL